MTTQFSESLRKTIEEHLSRYETRRSSILPILHAIQDEKGWIQEEHIATLEKEYNLAAVDVREVLTFYTMYRNKECKPIRFEVCNSISCWLRGSEHTVKTLRDKMNTWKKDTGTEAPFEVHEVACLGVCGGAPAVFVNKERHLNVTPELALKLVEHYAAKEKTCQS